MELPRIGRSDRGVFNGIKSRLGFATEPPVDEYGEKPYDDYGDYGDYAGYDDAYGSYDDYGQGRGDDLRSSHVSPSFRQSSYSDPQGESMGLRLVTSEDMRARVQMPDSLSRNPLPERRLSTQTTLPSYGSATKSSYGSGYSRFPRTVERASDYLRSTDTSDLPSEGVAVKSSGYDSLFSSTTPATQVSTASRTYDPYDSYAGTGVLSHNPSRSINVLKPVSYGEVERIAKTVKVGDVVILSLRNTPDHLAKRILDFSFGVSSALDASVDCIADKVFAIIRGRALSDEEKLGLRNQGVL